MEKLPRSCTHSTGPKIFSSFVHISNANLDTMSETLGGVLEPKHKKDKFIKCSHLLVRTPRKNMKAHSTWHTLCM